MLDSHRLPLLDRETSRAYTVRSSTVVNFALLEKKAANGPPHKNRCATRTAGASARDKPNLRAFKRLPDAFREGLCDGGVRHLQRAYRPRILTGALIQYDGIVFFFRPHFPAAF